MSFNSEEELHNWCQEKYLSAIVTDKNINDKEKELVELEEEISNANDNLLSDRVVIFRKSACDELKKIFKKQNNNEKQIEYCLKYEETLERFSDFHKSDISSLQMENYKDLLSIQLQEGDVSGVNSTYKKISSLDKVQSFQKEVKIIFDCWQQGAALLNKGDISSAIIFNNLSLYEAQTLRDKFPKENHAQLEEVNRNIYFNLGLCHKAREEYKNAAQYVYHSFQLSKEKGITNDNMQIIARITNELSNLYIYNINDLSKSVSFHREAIDYYTSLARSPDYDKFGNTQAGYLWKLLGDEYTKSVQIEDAIRCYNNTYNLCKYLDESTVNQANQNIITLLYHQLENVKEWGLSRYFSGVEYKNINDSLGDVYTRLQKYTDAIDCYKTSLMYVETLKDIGNAQGSDLEIINLCHKICAAHKDLGSHPSEATIYIEKINSYVQGYYDIVRKHIRSAEPYYNKNYKQDIEKANKALEALKKVPSQYVESGCIEGIETSIAEVIKQKEMGLSYYFGGMDGSARVDDADVSESGGGTPDDEMDCS